MRSDTVQGCVDMGWKSGLFVCTDKTQLQHNSLFLSYLYLKIFATTSQLLHIPFIGDVRRIFCEKRGPNCAAVSGVYSHIHRRTL